MKKIVYSFHNKPLLLDNISKYDNSLENENRIFTVYTFDGTERLFKSLHKARFCEELNSEENEKPVIKIINTKNNKTFVEYEEWQKNLKFHKTDGPAKKWYWPNGNLKRESWYRWDKKHKEDGPAVKEYHSDGKLSTQEWWFNDIEYKKEDFEEIVLSNKMNMI